MSRGTQEAAQVVEGDFDDGRRRSRRLRNLCWLVAATIGLLEMVANYPFMDPDGLSYLDISDAYLAGDWGGAVNAYWSPLFPALLALARLLIRPSIYWEFAVVHLVNFLIFLCSLPCFDFFLRELRGYQRARAARDGRTEEGVLPDWLWLLASYTAFLWASGKIIGVPWPSPDMAVTLIVYLAAGLTLRMRSELVGRGTAALLGAVLGVGYLTKTALLPVGCVFLFVNLLASRGSRRAFTGFLLSCAVFGAVALPFVAVLSVTKGRATFGDSGRLNYFWSVNGNKRWMHWQGEDPAGGVPAHPTRRIAHQPL